MACPVPEQLLASLTHQPGVNRYLVALSGGLDSTVLLHALASVARARPWLELRAVHVHHGLHREADAWLRHCVQLCADLGVPLDRYFAEIDAEGPAGPEAAAREARYRLLELCMQANDAVLMAHHANDQWETLLMRLHRGGGLRGLAGIPAGRRLGPGVLLRPLLDLPRAALCAYAEAHGLAFVQDPGNANPRYDRGFLRRNVLPALTERWPASAASAGRSARHLRAAAHLLDEVARDDLAIAAAGGTGLSIAALRQLSPRRRDNLLRHWIVERGFQLPSSARFATIENDWLGAREDAAPVVAWEGAELRRYRDRAYLLEPLAPAPDDWSARWQAPRPLRLPARAGVLALRSVQSGGLDPSLWREGRLRVRFRQGGERLRTGSTGRHKTLSNWFQEQGVPPWVRERMPLVWLDGELIAIADRWRAPVAVAAATGRGYLLEWQGSPPG